MGKHNWSVRSAVVEEEIVFQSKDSFETYIFNLHMRGEPFKVISQAQCNGYFVAVFRKRYGEYPFLGDVDVPSEETKRLKDVWDSLRSHGNNG